jgi:hypothetical protein
MVFYGNAAKDFAEVHVRKQFEKEGAITFSAATSVMP